jgi:acyl carrier protein
MAFERNDTFNKVVEIVAAKLAIAPADIKEDATLQDLGADSLDLVELVMKFEEVFAIEINDEEAEKFHNVREVVDYLNIHRKK